MRELPSLDDVDRPAFSTAETSFIVIHAFREGNSPAWHAQSLDITRLVMAMDFDSETFRRLRQPNAVFPLNVVIGRDGKITHVGQSVKAAVAAVKAALGKR